MIFGTPVAVVPRRRRCATQAAAAEHDKRPFARLYKGMHLAHDIQIVYDNSTDTNLATGEKRNLYLYSIAIDGSPIAATDSHEIYHAPGVGDFRSNGTMFWPCSRAAAN